MKILGDANGCKAKRDDCDANAEAFRGHMNLTRMEGALHPSFIAKLLQVKFSGDFS